MGCSDQKSRWGTWLHPVLCCRQGAPTHLWLPFPRLNSQSENTLQVREQCCYCSFSCVCLYLFFFPLKKNQNQTAAFKNILEEVDFMKCCCWTEICRKFVGTLNSVLFLPSDFSHWCFLWWLIVLCISIFEWLKQKGSIREGLLYECPEITVV